MAGSVIMVLIVLSEDNPTESTKTLLKRCAYILIPLSILAIKYYRGIGVGYNFWTGEEYLKGVTTDKNALGRLCLVSGTVLLWSISTLWRKKKKIEEKNRLAIDIFMLCLVFWLLIASKSATSLGIFIIVICMIEGLGLSFVKRNIEHINSFLIGAFLILFFLELSFNITKMFVDALGRNMTFTDRIFIWRDLINISKDPVFGVGFGSFWLGDRLKTFWEMGYQGIMEAHNGYLEIYLSLGFAGILLIIGVIFSSYTKIRKRLQYDFGNAKFQIAFLFLVLIYNITEAGFRESSLIWYILLFVGMSARSGKETTNEVFLGVRDGGR